MKNIVCPVCASVMHPGIKVWHWQCPKCDYQKADFQSAINETKAHQEINEQHRELGLRSLRTSNFRKLINVIIKTGISSGNLLEVGCGHGWFLDIARTKFSAIGIEPDKQVCRLTANRKLPVRLGFFPDALREDEQFDIIVFNDVFEHIADIKTTLDSCRAHLRTNGVLLLNLPSSSGIFYKLSQLLCRLSISKFFERLWQKDLPSPHLHYFNSKNLTLLMQSNGFEVVDKGTLRSIGVKGLYTRISYTGKYSLPIRLILCFAIVLAYPILTVMPSDIIYLVSRKN